jgi:hypothetical protein
MRGAEGPNKVLRSTKEKRAWQKNEKEGVQHVRQDVHEQLKMQSKLSKGSFKQEENTTTSHLPFTTWCHLSPIIILR